jgi:protein-tyrosine-phosphatase
MTHNDSHYTPGGKIIKPSLEFTCTANFGRSPPAESKARMELRSYGLENKYTVRSSGTLVDVIKSGNVPEKMMIGTINLWLSGDHASYAMGKKIEQVINDHDTNKIQEYFRLAVIELNAEERKHREEAIKNFGIKDTIKETQEQTIARPETIAIYSMSESNAQVVAALYERAGFAVKPLMKTLDVPDGFGKGRDAYFASIESLLKQVTHEMTQLLIQRGDI